MLRRVQLSQDLTVDDVHRLAAEPELQILQASPPVDRETWDLINEELLTRRPRRSDPGCTVSIRLFATFPFSAM